MSIPSLEPRSTLVVKKIHRLFSYWDLFYSDLCGPPAAAALPLITIVKFQSFSLNFFFPSRALISFRQFSNDQGRSASATGSEYVP